jgi:Flp pilus assembly protein TadD
LKEQGHVRRAVASYRQAIQLKPTHVEALNNLGLVLMETGALNEAIASFTQALAIMPGYLKALYNLGIAWSWTGEDEKAVACLQKAASVKHDHARPVNDLFVYRSNRFSTCSIVSSSATSIAPTSTRCNDSETN